MRVLQIIIVLSLLGGCQAVKHVPDVIVTLPDAIIPQPQYQDLAGWLAEVERMRGLSQEQLQVELQPFNGDKPEEPERLFRYAVLNQQLKDRLGWIRARDSLRRLSLNSDLSDDLVNLVRLLQFHNQSMINADARENRLLHALDEGMEYQQLVEEELALSREQADQLSEKIKALTNLENSMSIRRALTTDTPGDPVNE